MSKSKSQVLSGDFLDVITDGHRRELIAPYADTAVLAARPKDKPGIDALLLGLGDRYPYRKEDYDVFEIDDGMLLELMPDQQGYDCDCHKRATLTLSETYQTAGTFYPFDEPVTPGWQSLVAVPHVGAARHLMPPEALAKRWDNRAHVVANCSNLIITKTAFDENLQKNRQKIKYASTCDVRLCPFCAWRRSLRIVSNMRKIITDMELNNPGQLDYIFLTLTVPNVFGAVALDQAVDNIFRGWRRMTHAKNRSAVAQRFNGSILGAYRALEITRNTDYYKMSYRTDSDGKRYKHLDLVYDAETDQWLKQFNPLYGSYHPHLHCILAVPHRYFARWCDLYIDRDEFLHMWQWAMDDPTITQVDIRAIYPKFDRSASRAKSAKARADAIISAVVETTKYTVKTDDYLTNPLALGDLDLVLSRRHLVDLTGIFLQTHKKLGLSHPDTSLSGVLGEIMDDDVNAVWHSYAFHAGYGHYIRIDNWT